MPLASVTESTRLSDSVEIFPYWTPLCQLLPLLLIFIMKKEIITAPNDGGSRNSKRAGRGTGSGDTLRVHSK